MENRKVKKKKKENFCVLLSDFIGASDGTRLCN